MPAPKRLKSAGFMKQVDQTAAEIATGKVRFDRRFCDVEEST
jgi:hypothetical protein